METNVLFEYDGWRIVVADKLNLELQQLQTVTSRETKETREEWKWVGYHGNLRDALKQLADMAPRESKTLKDAIHMMDALYTKIDNLEVKSNAVTHDRD